MNKYKIMLSKEISIVDNTTIVCLNLLDFGRGGGGGGTKIQLY